MLASTDGRVDLGPAYRNTGLSDRDSRALSSLSARGDTSMPRKPILLSAILLASVMGAATAQTGPDSAANIKAHMAFLADDRLKGREAGSPEYDIAADYVASQM